VRSSQQKMSSRLQAQNVLILVKRHDFKSTRHRSPIRPCGGMSDSLCREEHSTQLGRETERAMPKGPCGRIGMARLRLDTLAGVAASDCLVAEYS
jgi:hypothetical protein